jgi:hypothetical protein
MNTLISIIALTLEMKYIKSLRSVISFKPELHFIDITQ